jgi:hypothetical protein
MAMSHGEALGYTAREGIHRRRQRLSCGHRQPVRQLLRPHLGPAQGAHPPLGRGYYSYTLGSWHVVSLNSSASMAVGSAQFKVKNRAYTQVEGRADLFHPKPG